jgi:carboxypeptidase Q
VSTSFRAKRGMTANFIYRKPDYCVHAINFKLQLPMKRRLFSVIFFALAAFNLSSLNLAAQSVEPLDTAVISQLKDEGITRSRIMETASWLTDVYGPRLTGSPQLLRASEWAKKEFEKYGMKNAALEAWSPFGKGWELERYSLQAKTPFASFPVISYPKAWSEGKNAKGEVVYIDIKSEEDFKKYKGTLKGKFVMISEWKPPTFSEKGVGKRHDPESLIGLANATLPVTGKEQPTSAAVLKQMQLQYLRTQFLFDEEPAAILDLTYRGTAGSVSLSNATLPVKPDVKWTDRPRPYRTESGTVLTQISLNPEHYGRIYRLLQKGIKVELDLSMKVNVTNGGETSYNVIAEIPGTDLSNEVVMLGAHLDSWHSGTGATDNAAGSAIMMEAVRLIQSLGIKPRRTIRIALWSGEEQGLLGSREYVKKHFADMPPYGSPMPEEIPVKPEHEKLSAYFNLDNGGGHIRGIYLQQNSACADIFRTWLTAFKEWNASTVSLSNTGGTDHLSFDAIGLPGFQFVQDPMDYGTWTHHSNMDTYERLVEDDMKHNAVIVAAFVYHAAMRDAKLPRKPIKVKVAAQP